MSGSTFLNFFIILFVEAQFVLLGFMSYWLGKNKRFDQRAFGFKTHSTFSNPEVWAVISKDWGLAIMLEGIASLIVTIVFREFVMQNYIVFISTIVGVALVAVVIFALRASKMAARARKISEQAR